MIEVVCLISLRVFVDVLHIEHVCATYFYWVLILQWHQRQWGTRLNGQIVQCAMF